MPDPKLFASGGNVNYDTDAGGGPGDTTDQATPRSAMRRDYGPSVTLGGRVTMANGRYVTKKVTPRRARWSR